MPACPLTFAEGPLEMRRRLNEAVVAIQLKTRTKGEPPTSGAGATHRASFRLAARTGPAREGSSELTAAAVAQVRTPESLSEVHYHLVAISR